jgi:hypothetical protein
MCILLMECSLKEQFGISTSVGHVLKAWKTPHWLSPWLYTHFTIGGEMGDKNYLGLIKKEPHVLKDKILQLFHLKIGLGCCE